MKRHIVRAVLTVWMAAFLAAPMAQPVAASSGFAPSEVYQHAQLQKAIRSAQKINGDVKGWLIVPGTNINEAVVHSSKNNAYYLSRDWRGNEYPDYSYKNYTEFPPLATYADYRVKLGRTWDKSSRNIVLYGHNYSNLRPPMDIGDDNDHTMFGQLPSYTDLDFAVEHPYIYYSSGENEGIWAVFSVAYCEPGISYSYSFEDLIAEWKARSMFDFDVAVDGSDRLLTLSTCTRQYVVGGNEYYENQRFVVVARLLRQGESDRDPIGVTVNASPKAPGFPAAAAVSAKVQPDA